MKSRCENPEDPNYANYGGRGIRVCAAWSSSFDEFWQDMGFPPEGTTLDRIDNNRGYDPDNCRWATAEQQMNNRRLHKKNISGVAGVTQDKASGRWRSAICVGGKLITLYTGPSYERAVHFRMLGQVMKEQMLKL